MYLNSMKNNSKQFCIVLLKKKSVKKIYINYLTISRIYIVFVYITLSRFYYVIIYLCITHIENIVGIIEIFRI